MLVALHAPAVEAAAWRPRFGVEAGPSFGRLKPYDPFELGLRQDWTLGGSASLVACWNPGRLWSIEFAPGWDRAIRHRSGDATFILSGGEEIVFDFSLDSALRFDRLALPIRAAFHPGGSAFSFEGGVTPAWTAHVEQTIDELPSLPENALGTALARMGRTARTDAEIFEDPSDLNDLTRSFDRWDVAATVGAGWDHPFPNYTFRFRARWQQGLVDLGKNGGDVHLSSASATFGFLW